MNTGILILTTLMFIGMDAPKEKADDDKFTKYIAASHKRSYITLTEGIGNIRPLYFEAHLAPTYMIHLKEEYKWAVELSPQMVIRMLREPSFPIRTPSYMPRITYYHNFHHEKSLNKQLIPYASLVHHSNGQNGDFYDENGDINTQDGNFATNYLEVGMFATRKKGNNIKNGNFVKTYAEYHFATDPNITDKYGIYRLNFEYQFIHLLNSNEKNSQGAKPRIRHSVQLGWIFGKMQNSSPDDFAKRFNFKYTASYHPRIAEDMSIFIQYYYGQDYYNIYYNNNISVLRFGLMTDLLKF